MMMFIQNLVLFCQLVLKTLSKNQILTSIKGRNSNANLQKTKIYYTNVDLVHENVFTKFGLILLIRSQDIEQNQILTKIYFTNVDLVHDNEKPIYQTSIIKHIKWLYTPVR